MDQRANQLNILTQGVNDQAYIVIFGHIVQLLSSFEKFIILGKEGRKKQKIMTHIKVDGLRYSSDQCITGRMWEQITLEKIYPSGWKELMLT